MSRVQNALPNKFVETVRSTFGAAGESLLRDLPQIEAESIARWNLELFDPFDNLSFNYVVPGRLAGGTQIVLKIGIPENQELHTEIAALRLYDGKGMARLIDAQPEKGVLLIERILPGVPLTSETDDSVATEIAAEIMRSLCLPAPINHSFPSTAKWFSGFGRLREKFAGGTGPLPESLVSRAEDLSTQLLESSSANVVLHGDLHHENILRSDRQRWLAIDPKGVVGEPCYEVGAFMRNPIELFGSPATAVAAVERRFKILGEVLGFDRDRMAAWAFAQAVLSAWWCLEDSGEGWEQSILCAETLGSFV
ncbi:MAG: aminoglycoside/hydroxyurea antibiotic resistance kinase [Acidobacteria bacterium]|nr:aminoglycoside/hydroxyurea antibiotic resistance kinase [Acidobacteriota bacterium]